MLVLGLFIAIGRLSVNKARGYVCACAHVFTCTHVCISVYTHIDMFISIFLYFFPIVENHKNIDTSDSNPSPQSSFWCSFFLYLQLSSPMAAIINMFSCLINETILLFLSLPLPCMDVFVTLPVLLPLYRYTSHFCLGSDGNYYCYFCCYYHPWQIDGTVEWMLCSFIRSSAFTQPKGTILKGHRCVFDIHKMLLSSPL